MSDWISVKDRLPDYYDWVLISCTDEVNHSLRYVPSVGIYRDGVWATKESDEYFNHCERVQAHNMESAFQMKVTHWMPLPDPPRD